MQASLPHLQFLKSAAAPGDFPAEDLAEVAFAGRSNAGKSSALNALSNQNALARVSKTPGRTQLINFFENRAWGRLVDLPGYGYAKVRQGIRRNWKELIGTYVERRTSLRGIVLVMDVRHPLTEFDQQMIEWARAYDRLLHVLLTKSDKLTFGQAKNALLAVQGELAGKASVQLYSATKKTGVEAARNVVLEWMKGPRALS